MKQFTHLTLLICLAFWLQPNESFGKQRSYDGYVVTTINDTLFGTVHLGGPTQNELRIKFTDLHRKQHTFTTKDLNSFAFQIPTFDNAGNKNMEWIYFVKKQVEEGPLLFADTEVFVEVRVLGEITLYDYYTETNSRKIGQQLEHAYYIEREGQLRFIKMTRKNYEVILKDLMSDFPLLAERIGTSGFGYKYIPKMVREYNDLRPAAAPCLGNCDPLLSLNEKN